MLDRERAFRIFPPLFDLSNQHLHGLPGNDICLLPDRGKRHNGLCRNTGIIVSDQAVMPAKDVVPLEIIFFHKDSKRVIRTEYSNLLIRMPHLDGIDNPSYILIVILNTTSQFLDVQLVGEIFVPADGLKPNETIICRCFRVNRDVDEEVGVTLISVEKTCRLNTSHQIVRIDTGDKLILPLDGDDGNSQRGEVRGWESVAQDNQAFNVVGLY